VFAPPASFGGASFVTGTMFVATYQESDGSYYNAAAFGAGAIGTEEIRGVGLDANNDIYITGRFSTPSLAFGATTLTNQGSYDVFLAKLGQVTLAPIAATSFGGAGDEEGLAITSAYYNSDIVIAGTFDQSINLGGGNLLTAGGTDIFLASVGTFP
jgi:hypothetical protein